MYTTRNISPSMRERKKLNFKLELKTLDPQGRFAGYASVFGVVDSQRDVVLPGAFTQTVRGRASEIKFLWQHQQDEPIGIFDTMFEDARGLYVEGRLLLNVQRAKEAHTLLKMGAISGLSIGYSPIRYTIDEKTGVRRLTQVDLWEVSLVTFPANDAANVTVVKQRSLSAHDERHVQQALSCGQLIALSDELDRAIAVLRE